MHVSRIIYAQIRTICACSAVTRRQNCARNTHNIEGRGRSKNLQNLSIPRLNSDRISMPQKNKHSLHCWAQGSWGERRRSKLPLTQAGLRSSLLLSQLLTLNQDLLHTLALMLKLVVKLWPKPIRESYVNHEGLLRCSSAIHSWFVPQLRNFNVLRAPCA